MLGALAVVGIASWGGWATRPGQVGWPGAAGEVTRLVCPQGNPALRFCVGGPLSAPQPSSPCRNRFSFSLSSVIQKLLHCNATCDE